uniref:DUF4283 domain-containing protein n=1 Tax=Kalanchoe fedtschenkoi TaxID=63787 RepID=A0A7N0VI75_KALFE
MEREVPLRGNTKSRIFDGGQPVDPRPPDGEEDGNGDGRAPMVQKQSYAAITRQAATTTFPSIDLPRRQPLNKDGKPALVFTATEIHACTQQLQFALIAKFSNGRPHISVVEREFNTAWKLDGRPIISDMDGHHILIILSSEKDVVSALTQAPRRVGTSLFRLFRWTPEFHHKRESTIISAWICTPRTVPGLHSRAAVEINVTKALPSEIWIDTSDGHGWWQEIVFEGNFKFCSKCKLHGHNLAECRKMRIIPVEKRNNMETGEKPQKTLVHKEAEWIEVRKKQTNPEKGPEAEQSKYDLNLEEGEIRSEVEGRTEYVPLEQTIPNMKKCHSVDQLNVESSASKEAVLERSYSMDEIWKEVS